jgi:hypothetical protein
MAFGERPPHEASGELVVFDPGLSQTQHATAWQGPLAARPVPCRETWSTRYAVSVRSVHHSSSSLTLHRDATLHCDALD